MDYKNLSLSELHELILSGKSNEGEIYQYFLERAKKYNTDLNAFLTLPSDSISEKGLPIAVKDTYCEK